MTSPFERKGKFAPDPIVTTIGVGLIAGLVYEAIAGSRGEPAVDGRPDKEPT